MIVLIVCMHRSGTSALAGMLHQNGIIMGEDNTFIPKPAPENPKGFYENVRFRSLNDTMLAENGYWVKSFSPMVPNSIKLTEQTKDIAEQLIYEYNKKYSDWGFKDPRLCLTYGAWRTIFDGLGIEHKVILTYRNFDNIAESMLARRNFGDHARFKALATAYYKMALKQFNGATIVVRFDNLISDPGAIAKHLTCKLGHPVTDISFIEPKLANRNL